MRRDPDWIDYELIVIEEALEARAQRVVAVNHNYYPVAGRRYR